MKRPYAQLRIESYIPIVLHCFRSGKLQYGMLKQLSFSWAGVSSKCVAMSWLPLSCDPLVPCPFISKSNIDNKILFFDSQKKKLHTCLTMPFDREYKK